MVGFQWVNSRSGSFLDLLNHHGKPLVAALMSPGTRAVCRVGKPNTLLENVAVVRVQ